MTFHVSTTSLQNALAHVCKYGDTDVFPHLPEIAFLRERHEEVIDELAKLDLDSHTPGSAIEALAPKSRYGFRIAHQLPVLDTLLLTAAVVEIADLVESHRQPCPGPEAFSYRFQLDGKGGLFRADRTYKDWITAQLHSIQSNLKIKHIIATDISDFYARINFHRLENLLDETTSGHPACRYIKKHIKAVRARQSFGLPVGGSAARILAELVLVDTDRALKDEGRIFTRFVDDFRVFLKAEENPYDVLAQLAEQLGINEGLSLNAAKTSIYVRTKYLARLKELVTDVAEEAEGHALDSLVADLYFGEPDEEELEKLKSMNLLGFLQEEAGKDAFDMGRIKVIFRALKITKPVDAIEYLNENFSELTVFARELTLLMQALEEENPSCFDDISSTVVDAILAAPASSVQLIRSWLLELFVRGTVPISAEDLKRIVSLPSALDSRQLHLIRGRVGDKNFFRKNKTAFGQLSSLGQTTFIWGASCLPKDEYKAWLSVVKPMYVAPLSGVFLKWVESEQSNLFKKLNVATDEHWE